MGALDGYSLAPAARAPDRRHNHLLALRARIDFYNAIKKLPRSTNGRRQDGGCCATRACACNRASYLLQLVTGIGLRMVAAASTRLIIGHCSRTCASALFWSRVRDV